MSTRVKKAGKWVSLCCTLVVVWINIIHSRRVKFESNDNYHLYTKNDSERR
ncbi:AAA 11 domain-containing protein [Aphis craccivora]|uniref:AAA 11 domain-containing protein n=1 Tax=Aphis craccivora TaxID=307492 RepID=A0A6G0YQK2_APHCR|nr:AAA 11 domain-containing protein [Aphis craccivora]